MKVIASPFSFGFVCSFYINRKAYIALCSVLLYNYRIML